MKVALAQVGSRLGDLEANLQTHLVYIAQAVAQQVELLIFPEMSLAGYRLRDLVPAVAIRPTPDHPLLAPLLAASRQHAIDLVVGFPEVDRRERHFISAAYLSDGHIRHIHRKVYLPTYGLFEDSRYFAAGDQVRAFETRFGRVGLLICEDFWHLSPPYLLWLDGADILIFTSASPARGVGEGKKLGSTRWVEQINEVYASAFTNFVLHCNRVGFEDGLHFWGGSAVYSPDGVCLTQGVYHDEALIMAELDLRQLRRTRARLPLLRDERPDLMHRELERIWRTTYT